MPTYSGQRTSTSASWGSRRCCREPDISAGFLGNGNTHHDVSVTQISEESLIGREGQVLVPEEFGKRPDLFHIAFEMENEADLVALPTRAPSNTVVTIIMTVDHSFAKSVYLLDAERNMLEFTSDSVHDWRATYREFEGKLVTGPWTPGELEPETERYYSPDPEIRRIEGSAVHSRRTTHAVLGCRDLDEQLAFYREVGGLEIAAHSQNSGIAVLKGAAADYSIVLFQAIGDQKPGYHHMAFEVSPADFDGDIRRLEQSGIAIESRLDHPAKKAVLLRDPDGHGVEFYAPLGKTARIPAGGGTAPLLAGARLGASHEHRTIHIQGSPGHRRRHRHRARHRNRAAARRVYRCPSWGAGPSGSSHPRGSTATPATSRTLGQSRRPSRKCLPTWAASMCWSTTPPSSRTTISKTWPRRRSPIRSGVNVLGTIYMTKACLPALKASKGSIVNISSTLAKLPILGASVYSATKGALESFNRAIALELGPSRRARELHRPRTGAQRNLLCRRNGRARLTNG